MEPTFGTIFESLDYREFLRNYYQQRREVHAYFSLRYFGAKIGMDSSFLIRVFQGKNHIAEDLIGVIAKFLKMTRKEEEYFENLVGFNKAKTDGKARTFYEKLQKIRGVGYVTVEASRAKYFQDWWCVAMRSLLDYHPFDGNFTTLAAQFHPSITVDQAKQALYLLLELGMLQRTEDGGYAVVDNHLHSGFRWDQKSIQDYQRQTMQLAIESLTGVPKPQRDVSTVTMNICPDDLGGIRMLIEEFQENVAKLVEESKVSDRVYQLNVQLFPLTKGA